jgi:CheY-like chemotaxis protein
VTLPPLAKETPAPPPPSALPVPGRRGRILVVDDEPAIGAVLRRVLGADHDLTILTNPRDAVERIAAGTFDVILCDLMMPDMTGMDLHDEVQRTRPDQADRMVFVTGGAFTHRAREFLDRMPHRRLDKPFDIHRLRRLIDERLK